jgi:hypothetical protein
MSKSNVFILHFIHRIIILNKIPYKNIKNSTLYTMADYEVFIKENAQVRNVDRSTCDDKKNWIQTWRMHTNTSKKVLTCCYFGCGNEAKLGGKYINQY